MASFKPINELPSELDVCLLNSEHFLLRFHFSMVDFKKIVIAFTFWGQKKQLSKNVQNIWP
ncbi:hypothetical protein HMPREF3213_01974 [Heyndrickxia coagulans]|uniref:Uncharacterized protein n=1 Tax=Heyndrickxia coagulans TaxID=1398 RepID=A0A133KPD4_HEYCO|nr:hypothetical protein HMPREF3213_01974 [Heyndrickxia coagulans]